MKKIIFLFTAVTLMAFSCSKSDDDYIPEPLRDYTTQRDADKNIIETYLSTHKLNPDITDYSANVNNSNLFVTCTENDAASLAKLTTTSFPKLLTKEVEDDGIKYIVYYLVFNEGSSTEKPCPFDEVLVTYRGTSLASGTSGVVSATEFENSALNSLWYLPNTISGWQEIFPMFGKGVFDETATGNGPNAYINYGAGIMFLPSGLAYYNGSSTNIPSYSPLVFSFQLMNFKRIDNDSDGIFTVDEIVKNTNGIYNKDSYVDTDADGVADYRDFDDDNDGFPTRNEIKKTDGTLYLFNEIPDCNGLATDPNRIKRHLIKCQ